MASRVYAVPLAALASAALACLSVAAGCASSPSTDASASTNPDDTPGVGLGPCELRSGSYRVHEVERAGGSCGPVADQTFSVDASGALVVPQCTGSDSITSDRCKETLQLTCSAAGQGATRTFTSTGTVTWSVSGRNGVAAVQVSGACSSQYDVTFTRQ